MNPAVNELVGRVQYLGTMFEEEEKVFATRHALLQESILRTAKDPDYLAELCKGKCIAQSLLTAVELSPRHDVQIKGT